MIPGKFWRAENLGYTCNIPTIGQQVKPESELLMSVSVEAEQFPLLHLFSLFLLEDIIGPVRL